MAIDLSRLPSHGQEAAVWMRGAKTTRAIPIIFVGGEAARVSSIRALLPEASFCMIAELGTTIQRALKGARNRSPVTPPSFMERSGVKSAARKLGIQAGAAVCVIEPPRAFSELPGILPDSVEFRDEAAPVIRWFINDTERLLISLRRVRNLAMRTKLWVLWQKGSGNGVSQNRIREATREVGLVDYRIC